METCPNCGQASPEGFKFCGECGLPLGVVVPASREERKVITVLFADLVGFTSRAERLDPEDVRALLSPYYARLRHELERHGGTVEKFIGDAVVALFGAPVTHEDDPERAVRAAIAIREAILELNEADSTLELEVRIAVNTGEALIALGSRPELGEGMASGDVVNTASRLQTAAPVGGILVGETTYRATRGAIEYRAADPVEAKGKAEPVLAWEALRARARFGFDVEQSARTPLVGRERELGVLVDALARVRDDLSPQLVTLVGVPGIGKSRLIVELFQVVDRDPELISWRQGRSLPYGEALSYWALAEIVKSQLGVLETDSVDTVQTKLSETVAAIDPGEAEWLERHLRPLAGLGVPPAEGGDRRAEAFGAWRRFLEGVAERTPLVLVFEDLHWADDGLLDFVDYLADWANGIALLIVCTARPELLSRRSGWGGGKRNASSVTVSALAPEETGELLAALLEQALLPAEVQVAVLRQAEGNPLFAEEYVRMLQDRGFLVRGDSGWQLETDELPLPETVQGMIAARLDSLPHGEKELIQNAAVIGKVFWPAALGSLSESESPILEEQLHALERKEFVRRERRSGVAGETQYAFLHLLLRDVAYGQIPRAERADKHRRAAKWIESLAADRSEDRAEMLSHHYLEALELARATGADELELRDAARKALSEAADRALALHAPSTAGEYLERALDLMDERDPARARLLYRYASTRWQLGQSEVEAAETATELALELGDRELAAEALVLLSHMRWLEGRRDLANQHVDNALNLIAELPPSRTTAAVRVQKASRLWISGAREEGLALAEEALAEAREFGADDVVGGALRAIGSVRASRGDEGGIADLEESIEVGRRLNDPLAMHLAANNLANMHWHFGRLAEGAQYIAADRETQARFGSTPDSGTLRWLDGEEILLLEMSGAWRETVRRAEAFVAAVGDERHYLIGPVLSVTSNVRIVQGDLALALRDSDRALEIAREVQDPQQLHPALLSRARALFNDGRRDESNTLLDELLAARPALNEYWFRELAWVLLEHGREAEYLEAAEGEPITPWLEAGLAVARRDFPAAAALYERIGAKGAEAVARLHMAELLIGQGDRGAADAELQHARAFFVSEGADPYLRRCEALLAAAS